ncbi:MAG TPA: hypothetical protein VFW62_08655 [bacterium]|nr:hypothetical protein [bacterium]
MSAVSGTTSSQNHGENPQVVRGEITRSPKSEAEAQRLQESVVKDLQRYARRLFKILRGESPAPKQMPQIDSIIRRFSPKLPKNGAFIREFRLDLDFPKGEGEMLLKRPSGSEIQRWIESNKGSAWLFEARRLHQ